MALADLLSTERKTAEEVDVTPERITENLDKYRHTIAYWRMYPDRLVDYYCSLNPKNTFHFY